MTEDQPGRRIFQTDKERFEIYDLDGEPNPKIDYLPLSYDRDTSCGTYVMRMQPGTKTVAHTHQHREEFMVLEGHLIEPDGTILGPGDHVSFAPGTHHNSRTEDGCVLIVFEWG